MRDWVKLSERVPTWADADVHGYVWFGKQGSVGLGKYTSVEWHQQHGYLYWMSKAVSTPAPPHGEER